MAKSTKPAFLKDKIEVGLLPLLLGLYAFGIGKAALMPLHRWLPAAMVAPTPVSALLHAVAVVKAGVFTMLLILTNVFGIEFLSKTGASNWLVWLASFTLLTTSIIAIYKDNLKARLAYSTISQLSYITLAATFQNEVKSSSGRNDGERARRKAEQRRRVRFFNIIHWFLEMSRTLCNKTSSLYI